jgi:hypothetical protein
MFRPFLVVGIGGSGGKTVRAARQALQFKLDQQGWDGGWPEAWQFLHIDSPTTPDGLEFPAPLLPQENYLSLVPNGVGYKTIHDKVIQGLGAKLALEVQRSLPSPAEVKVPVGLGAGAFRAVGRTIAAAAMKDIYDKVRDSLGKMQSTSADAELKEITRLFGAEVSASQTPTVVVISSVAGGSGAGMFIDVAEAIKAAIGAEEWAHRIFSLLFAPDVFAELGPKNLSVMVPNAMGALAELVSGFWRSTPTEGTLALYRKHGLNVPQDTKSTIGPAFNYIIGRKNGNANPIDFGSQAGVYKALANSLAAWMTDAVIQDDLSAYAVANFQTKSASLQDNSQLATISAGQPLSSLGFARVSLGTDKFFEYAGERMAKQTLKTLLSQHTATDPELKEKKEEQWIEYYTTLNEGAFIADSGLDELTEENNQVILALQPDTTELQTRLKSAITSAVTNGMPKGGHNFEKWVALIVNAFEVNLPSLMDDLGKLRHEKGRQWVDAMPEQVLSLVSKTMSQQGLAVTAKLMERLINQTKAAADELLQERSAHLRDAAAVTHTVSQAMGPASSMNAIPTNHPTVANALHQAELAFYWASMAELKQTASELMLDFSENFLEPLQLTLSRGFVALKDATSDPKLPDNTTNPYAGWPDFAQKGVADHFLPAPNESMLIDVKDFPAEFDALVEQTVNDPAVTASRIVIDEVLMGSRSPEVAKLQENQQWEILQLRQIWIPKNRHYQVRQAANQPAVFSAVTDHMQFLDFAKKWIKVPGRAFRAYMDQTIPNYLKGGGNQAVQSTRSKKFAAAISSAIQSADPLVDLDQQLLAATHGAIGRNAICSGIPLDKSDPMRDGIDNTLVSNGYNPEKGWYISGSKAANAKSIEIFTQMTISMSPIPMSSMLEPMLQEWSKAGHEYSARTNFMTWRRGRSLPEAIPAHPEQWQAMLNGWFVARLLNLFEHDKSDPSFKEKGPRLSIWGTPATGWVDFPYPLHSAHIANNVDDFPAIVLDSLIVAMASCHGATSLKPLEPYQRLLDLGGSRGTWEDLSLWILEGKVQQGAPLPRADRAGTQAMSAQERQDLCADYLDDLLTKFRDKMSGLDAHADSRTYPISWELRKEIEYALDAGIRAVRSIEPEEEL